MTTTKSTQTTTAIELKGLKVSHRRWADITGTINHVSRIDGTLSVRWDASGEITDGWTLEELSVSLADIVR